MGTGIKTSGRGKGEGLIGLARRFTFASSLSLLFAGILHGQACDLYPIAFSAEALQGVPPGSELPDVFNGTTPGDFGWLTWRGSPSESALVRSLMSPGDSDTFVNPDETQDHQVSVGDWVLGKPGVSNSKAVRDALDALKGMELVVPVWDEVREQGSQAAYHVAGFAQIRMQDYRLPGRNRISAQFLGHVTCGALNTAPAVEAGPDQTLTLPAKALLEAVVTDDGLPAGGDLTLTWSQISGAGMADFANVHSPETTVTFDLAGTYVVRLEASDGELVGRDEVVLTVNRPNQAPMAQAGSVETDEDVALDLTLQGSDPDGDALRYIVDRLPSFGRLSGPAPALHYAPLADFNGTDSFSYKVTDGQLESAPATVSITIHPVNDPPMVDSQALTSGEDQGLEVVLSGADVEGSSLSFSLLSSPTNGMLHGSPPLLTYRPQTNFHGSDAFMFAATDGALTSAVGIVELTITNVNDAPVVDAGMDQTISWPSNSVVLAGQVLDDAFTPFLQTDWSLVNGPGTATFADTDLPTSAVVFSTPGTYRLRLTANDALASADDDVVITVNAPPVVDAGPDQTNTLPARVTVEGVVSDDGLPVGATNGVNWSIVSGPGTVVFADPTSIRTTASFSESGIYRLRLTANDSLASSADEVAVLANQAPRVDAGSDQTNSSLQASLAAAVSDDGIPSAQAFTLSWTKVSGPGEAVFAVTTNPVTTVAFSRSGVYVLRLTAGDSLAETWDDLVVVANAAPSVDAGSDLRITVGDEVWLEGIVTDDGLPEGVSVAVEWSVMEGTGQVQFEMSNQARTLARFFEIGTYILRLNANDSLTNAFDDLAVTVLPVNQAPSVVAGPRQLVLQPAVAVLSAAVHDDELPEGAPVTVFWKQVSGPGTAVFDHPTGTNTTVTFSAVGDYLLRLTASDTALSSHADVLVAVRTPAMNQPPAVNAGEDLVVGLTHDVTLEGRIDDDGLPQGVPVSAAWSLVSGPDVVQFAQPSDPQCKASFSELGTYVLRLTATDSELSGSDEVTVTVYPFNQPPVVEAGSNQTVVLPDPVWLNPPTALPSNIRASRSLLSVDRWNNAIGQPGITGDPAGGFLWVARNGLDVDDGTLVVAGGYTNANGVEARSLARFDGSNWFNFFDTNVIPETTDHNGGTSGSTVDWLVYDCDGASYCSEIFDAAAVRGDEVFVGGIFKDLGNLDGLKDLTARWDGERWRSWGFKRLGNQVRVVETDAQKVYVGGRLCFQPTNASPQTLTNLPWCYGMAVWDGTNWVSFDHGLMDLQDSPETPTGYPHGWVNDIAVAPNGHVFAAGSFVLATPRGLAKNIAEWDGIEWTPLGEGLSGTQAGSFPVMSIAVAANGDLYAGGSFTNAGGRAVRRLARWDGAEWRPVGDGPANGMNDIVEAIAIHGRDVYAGGSFSEAGGLPSRAVARWTGEFWSPLGSAAVNGVNGTVYALAVDDSGLYVGGAFTEAGGSPANNLAKWEFAPPPRREVSLTGLVTDDGLPTGGRLDCRWIKVSGPGESTFADPTSPVTTVGFTRAGSYILRLVADDSDLTGQDELTITVRANEPPVVDAGPDHVIGFDEPLALKGAVIDDGLPESAPVHHIWQQVYGPGTVTFDDPAQTSVTARFSRQGTYILRLSANDSHFTTQDEVTVIVMPRNQPPTVYPGLPVTVVLGSPLTLNASVTDDGYPAGGMLSVAWSLATGPGEVSFDDANLVRPTVTFSTPGLHVLRMTATDSELTAANQVTVNVLAPVNRAPAVDAGPDQTLTNGVTYLQGSVIDDGNPMDSSLEVYWTTTGSSGTVAFANSNSPTTAVSFSRPGTYWLRLYAKDGAYTTSDAVVVNVLNQPPTLVSAGPDRSITLPVNSLTLEGCVLDDGTFTGVYWSRISGPGGANITAAGTLQPTITLFAAGTNVFNLRVWDNSVSYEDRVTVIVTPEGNTAPAVDAGADQTGFLSTNSLTLHGTATDDGLPAGTVMSTRWQQVAGPAPATISPVRSLDPQVLFTAAGTYLFRLIADDGALTNGDDVIVTVNPPLNEVPAVEAGPDVITRVTNSLSLGGVVRDDALPAEGRLSAFWLEVSGPGIVEFDPPGVCAPATNTLAVNTTVSFSRPGTYVLRLLADDSETAVSDDVVVTVLDADDNQAPRVDAGLDAQTVAYSPFILSGHVTDDGRPPGGDVSTLWTVIESPDRVYFSDATALTPYAQFIAEGTYVLRLTANDTRLASFDDVVITVCAPTNHPPLVFAGLPLTVTRPDPALLQGVVLDDGLPIGQPLQVGWTVVGGPADVTFLPDAHDPLALAWFSAPGEYTLRLVVEDSEYSVVDDVTVTVLPGTNAPPHVHAGPDFTVALGDPAPLTTDVADDGLEQGLLQAVWSQVSGPGTASFSTLNGVYQATFDAEGDYTLRLTAHDGSLTNSDEVVATVVDAGPPGAEILEPVDGSILTAPTDIRGTVGSLVLDNWTLEYRLAGQHSVADLGGEGQEEGEPWATLAGGSTTIVSNTLAAFDPTLQLNGLYELRLTATDTLGRSAITEPVTVIVDRHLKIGHFTLSFTDMTVPVAGIPIEIVRTYDSRETHTNDFGVGWSLDIRNVRVQKNRAFAPNWRSEGGDALGNNYFLDPVRPRIVTLTFPDGRVQKFEARPDPETQFGLPISASTIVYHPLDNTRGTLVSLSADSDDVLLDGYSGVVNLVDYRGNLYEPTRFQYTGEEGDRYIASVAEGLEQMSDPNGNTLLISTNGVVWTNVVTGGPSRGIAFVRDDCGRICQIIDPNGHALHYTYGWNGSLAAFTDRTTNTTTFDYTNAAFPHLLTEITDSRGVNALRTEYDAAGRMVRQVDGAGHAIEFTHDPANRMEIVRDRLGHATVHEYDQHGNVIRTTDALGHVTRMTYDAADNLLERIDPLGRTNRFEYDTHGNRVAAVDALGDATRLTYGPLRRLTSSADANGNLLTNLYDPAGNLVQTRDALGNVTCFTYEAGQLISIENAEGGGVGFDCTAFGQWTRRVDPLGHVVARVCDANGNVLRQITTRMTGTSTEQLITTFEYDAENRAVRQILPDGATQSVIYAPNGLPSVSLDPLGRRTEYEYDSLNRLIRVIHPDGTTVTCGYDAEGRITERTNPLGRVTRFFYDPLGRFVGSVLPDGSTTSNRFDAAGQLIAGTDARGFTTTYGYDRAGRLTSITNALGQVNRSAYDRAGNVTTAVDALGRSTHFGYDALNRHVHTTFPDGTTMQRSLNVMGRCVAQTDPAGLTTRFGYDRLGRLTSVTNALGHVTRYAYDEVGNQITQTDANDHTTTFEYDPVGRCIRRVLPGGQIESRTYDLCGLLTRRIDFNGDVTSYEYDSMNRLLARIPDPRRAESPITFAYNALGLRTNMIDAAGSSSYRYDVRNRLVEKVRTWAAVGLALALNYGHDANGNLTSVVSSDPNGAAITYEYDALNRLQAADDPRLGSTTYHYDATGNLTLWSAPNGLTHRYEYDALNRLTNVVSGTALTPIASFGYALGSAGNRLTASEQSFPSLLDPRPSALERIYTYDDVYHLTGERITLSFPPDGNGATIRQLSTLSYSYDPAGNRHSRQSSIPHLLSASYAYDLNDRLAGDTFDANGNTQVGRAPLPVPGLLTCSYDFENRLTHATRSDGTTITVQYDGDGNRVGKTVTTSGSTRTTFYLVDDLDPTGYPQALEEHIALDAQPATLAVVYSHGLHRISQDRLTGDGSGGLAWQAGFYGYDGHNSVRYLADLNGNVTDTYDYDAFGNLIFQSAISDLPTPNSYLFTGEAYDPDLGLYYLRARYHNPDTGRFWTADTFGGLATEPASLHRYTYVFNNPVNAIDPSGHYTLAEAVVTTQISSVVNAMAVHAGHGTLMRMLEFGGNFSNARIQELYDAIETVQVAMLASDLYAAVQVGRAAPAVLGAAWNVAGSAIAKLSRLTPRQWLGLRMFAPKGLAQTTAQVEAVLNGADDLAWQGGGAVDDLVKLADRGGISAAERTAVQLEFPFARGASVQTPVVTTVGETFVRVGAGPQNLKFGSTSLSGAQPGTYAFPEGTFNAVGQNPAALKNLGDLPGVAPQYFRVLRPPPGTPIQRGIVPGGQYGGVGGAEEVIFPKGF